MKTATAKQYNANDLKLSIDPTDLKPLFRIQSSKHAFALMYNWAIIIASIFFGIQYFNPLVYLLVVLIVGARMHALAILLHDATHYRFMKNRKWNDIITNLICAYPVFTTLEDYRENHLRHHQHLNTEHDPDWVAKLGNRAFTFPKTKREFLTTLLSYFLLYQGLSDAIWFFKRFNKLKSESQSKSKYAGLRLVFFLCLFALLSLTGTWVYYLIFWVVPYLSTFFMIQYIRSVAEHFGELSYDHLLTSTRTVRANLLERFFIAPHNVGYHLEHHLYPGVPFYNLKKLHHCLMEDRNYQHRAHLTQGYMSGLLNELGVVEGTNFAPKLDQQEH